MIQKKLKSRVAIAVAIVLSLFILLFENRVLGNPSDISGTWDIEANQYTGTLVIDGAQGELFGSVFDQSIQGFYIPSSRRIVFVRKYQTTPYQFYEGTVSSSGRQINGEFHAWNEAGGASMAGVDFNFFATKR